MSNKDDCISRRDAIGEISEHGTIWMSYTDDMSACEIAMEALSNAKDTMIRIIKGLPAVQPDCALKEFGDCSYSETGCSDCKIKNRIRTALNVAQPEIIRCKNCKYWVVEEDEAYCYRIVMVHGAKDGSGFCSDAERKMDNERTD